MINENKINEKFIHVIMYKLKGSELVKTEGYINTNNLYMKKQNIAFWIKVNAKNGTFTLQFDCLLCSKEGAIYRGEKLWLHDESDSEAMKLFLHEKYKRLESLEKQTEKLKIRIQEIEKQLEEKAEENRSKK